MTENSRKRWHFGILLALAIALFVGEAVQAQATLPNEIPDKKEEIRQGVKGSIIKIDPEPPKDAREEVTWDNQKLPEKTSADYNAVPEARFGFHIAVGVPHPTSFGVDYLGPAKIFEFSMNVGAFATTASNVDMSLVNQEFSLMYHPWAGSFFFGLIVGQQSLKGKKEVTISGNAITAEVAIKCTYFTPHIGWHAVWDSGFSLGFELGYQTPSRNSTDFTTNAASFAGVTSTAEYQQLETDVRDQGDKIGKIGLPYVTFLRLGWMF